MAAWSPRRSSPPPHPFPSCARGRRQLHAPDGAAGGASCARRWKAAARLALTRPEVAGASGVTALPMTCHSGGSVDIYLEPMLPPPQLLIFGESPCARALARLG